MPQLRAGSTRAVDCRVPIEPHTLPATPLAVHPAALLVPQEGNTALLCAAAEGHVAPLQQLHARGANAEARDKVSPSPLAKQPRLMAEGPSFSGANETALCPTVESQSGRTALMKAALEGHVDALSQLLDWGMSHAATYSVREPDTAPSTGSRAARESRVLDI